MKYAIYPISHAYPDCQNKEGLREVYSSYVYDYTNDLESAIFISKYLLSKKVYRVHVKDLFDIKAIILRDGNVTSPEVLVRI